MDVREAVKGLSCPIFAIHARQDRLLPMIVKREIDALAKRTTTIDGPHFVMETREAHVAEVVRGYFGEI